MAQTLTTHLPCRARDRTRLDPPTLPLSLSTHTLSSCAPTAKETSLTPTMSRGRSLGIERLLRHLQRPRANLHVALLTSYLTSPSLSLLLLLLHHNLILRAVVTRAGSTRESPNHLQRTRGRNPTRSREKMATKEQGHPAREIERQSPL